MGGCGGGNGRCRKGEGNDVREMSGSVLGPHTLIHWVELNTVWAPYGTMWALMGPYETVWALMGPYGLLLNRMGTYGRVELNTVWDRMGTLTHTVS